MGNNVSHDITVNPRSVIVISTLSIAYLVLSYFLVGFKGDQVVLLLLANGLFYASKVTRKFFIAYLTFLVYWVIFDYMKAFPNYRYNTVHMADLYNFEKHLFGIHFNGILLTPNEYLKLNSTSFLDVTSGIFYLCWIPVPFGFGIYLFITNRRQCLEFLIAFVVVNLVGFVIYYAYPAAPPWYIQDHGYTLITNTGENVAGLIRFDNYFHARIFQSIYTKGSNVFAAMPSLHSAYPIVVFYYAAKNRLYKASVVFGIVTVGIWFGAVYTSHHYVLDVLAGIACAIAGISLFNLLMHKWGWFGRFVDRYESLIKK
ncbi:phosphatase PAP2 family protein [Mucilaginibacter ginsenosidivorans]|uniref:Inositol phosphorylceramide synthase n=1 Tax=Mucilaginibacter ginsenosidivorans TaxID=398053 RepID=A0A5B8V199_9SPHI|nr:phosphatase PAP2 family protein [Mucilaginibacter ginsenosidivorans]QEC64593.1 inositol phosphorylceramide synthase [Mucilaginibacter ginsenosidivorans]